MSARPEQPEAWGAVLRKAIADLRAENARLREVLQEALTDMKPMLHSPYAARVGAIIGSLHAALARTEGEEK